MSDSKLYTLRPGAQIRRDKTPSCFQFPDESRMSLISVGDFRELFTEFDIEQLQQQVEEIIGDALGAAIDQAWLDGAPQYSTKIQTQAVAAVVGLLKGETE